MWQWTKISSDKFEKGNEFYSKLWIFADNKGNPALGTITLVVKKDVSKSSFKSWFNRNMNDVTPAGYVFHLFRFGLQVFFWRTLKSTIAHFVYFQQRLVFDISTFEIYHQMDTFAALLALCAGNSPVTGEFPTKRHVARSFDVSLYLRLNKTLE